MRTRDHQFQERLSVSLSVLFTLISSLAMANPATLVIDPTPGGTGDCEFCTEPYSDPADFFQLDNVTLFSANDGADNRELWRTDGTAPGTYKVKEINPLGSIKGQTTGSDPRHFTAVNGEAIFTAYTDATGRELWKTDGTPAGTVLIKDIIPGSDSSIGFSSIIPLYGKVYFQVGTDHTRAYLKTHVSRLSRIIMAPSCTQPV